MDKHVILHRIPKEAEGTYYTIAFPVPGGLERISVSYSYKRLSGGWGRPSRNLSVVDLGLLDAGKRFLGWSGSARSMVFVGPYASTSGYLMKEIEPGQWHIIVGAYKVPDGGLDVRYEIEYTPKSPRWLAGDPHVHSSASDGQHDAAALAKKAHDAGLDFIALANHNNFAENLHLPVVPGITLLPAVEWTHYRGHMNFYGVSMPFHNSFVANSDEEMLSLVAYAREKGGLVSVNHPKCTLCPYLWDSGSTFDLIEVWNGPMRKVNSDAIAWWHTQLMDGRKLPLIGGSDYHRDLSPVRIAHPVTKVFSVSPAADDILDAIAHGHSYVTASVGGIAPDLRCGSAMMGDSVAWREDLELSVSASGLQPGVQVKLVTSGGAAAVWNRFSGGVFHTRTPVLSSWRFAYLVAVRVVFGRQFVRAITNPIYFDH